MNESSRYVVREIYCEVVFELAEQFGRVDEVMDDLNSVAAVIEAESQFRSVLSSQAIRPAEKVEMVKRVFSGKVSDLTLNFICALARRGRMGFLNQICDRYEMLYDNYKQRCHVEVTLAEEPDEARREKLKADLEAAIDHEVKLEINTDPEIIGGIVIKKGDRVIDNSINTTLSRAVKAIIDNAKEKVSQTFGNYNLT
jgi:F-type H+-transporting ATPase subunit delta